MRPLAVAITDRREMEFDLQAVKQVLEWSPRAAQAFGLPPSVPRSVRCNPAESYVEVIYGVPTATRVFILRAEALGAILISYCNRVGMPVPRGADKAVRIEREHVVLVFKLWLDRAMQPEAQEVTVARAPEAVRAWAWIETEK